MAKKDDGRTSGGSSIIRHEAREPGWTPPAAGIEGADELIEEHMQSIFGPVDSVLHEIISDLVHLDVHLILPSAEHPYNVLFTTGMGDLPMTLPPGCEADPRAELMIALPPEWEMSQDGWIELAAASCSTSRAQT